MMWQSVGVSFRGDYRQEVCTLVRLVFLQSEFLQLPVTLIDPL